LCFKENPTTLKGSPLPQNRMLADINNYGIDETYFTHSWFYEERRCD